VVGGNRLRDGRKVISLKESLLLWRLGNFTLCSWFWCFIYWVFSASHVDYFYISHYM